MIETEQVQEPMRKQHRYLIPQRALPLGGLASRSFKRDDDISQHMGLPRDDAGLARGECQDVGGLVFAAMVAIETVNRRVVAEQDRELRIGQSERLEHAFCALSDGHGTDGR